MKALLVTGLLAVALSGCAVPQATRNYTADLNAGNIPGATENAIAQADEKDGAPRDLLWALEAGTLLRHNGLFERSTKMLDGAEELMKEDDTRNLVASGANQTMAVLVNDNVMPYSPAVYDTVMLNTYKALNFWQQGDYDNARIEWNRTDDRQRRASEHFESEIDKQRDEIKKEQNSDLVERSVSDSSGALKAAGVDIEHWAPYTGYVNPASLYLHGLYFLLNGENKADYDRAHQSLQRAFALTKNSQVKVDMNAAKRPKKLKPSVWIVFENGLAARKEERRIDLPLFLVTGNVNYTGIALPIMGDGQPAHPYVAVGRQQSQLLADMDTIIRGEFKTKFSGILIREIIRATAKTVVQKQLNDSSPWLGLIAAVAQAATTQADLRGWMTLPQNFQLLNVPYPANKQVVLSFPGIDDITVDLPEKKQPIVIYVRALNPASAPSIHMLASK
ncbi:hypothetical protein V0R37_11715 [Pollutimonas sp. H1-120]|uniref:COG3014 family protein n=1 Tax=Pollutimonas sp. H1-120 TaxID=3148824 RepID=UPI003B51F19B